MQKMHTEQKLLYLYNVVAAIDKTGATDDAVDYAAKSRNIQKQLKNIVDDTAATQ